MIIVSSKCVIIVNEIIMKINNATDLGKAIRQARKLHGYTQQEVADFSGCSLMFVSNLERGKPTSELEKAIRVASTVGLDLISKVRGDIL